MRYAVLTVLILMSSPADAAGRYPETAVVGTGFEVSATVSNQESITLNTPVEYAEVCKPGKISDDCIHSVEAMEHEAALARDAANIEPSSGDPDHALSTVSK